MYTTRRVEYSKKYFLRNIDATLDRFISLWRISRHSIKKIRGTFGSSLSLFSSDGSLSDLFLKYQIVTLIMDFLEEETTNELFSFLTPFNYFPR